MSGVRFAPAPSGALHAGNGRVALLNFLLARERGWRFVLRFAVIADAILTKPPSAELIPQQKDEDDLMPYDRLDAILHGFLEQNSPLDDLVKRGISKQDAIRVRHLLLRSEYKRRQSPPGVKVTSCHLGRDRRYPIINGGGTFL